MKRLRRVSLAACTLVLLAGCGDGEPTSTAAETVPSLATRLEKVDDLVVDRRWSAARAELRGIIATANDAREAGDLDVAAADRVVASAQRLLAALPTPAPTTTPTPTSTPSAQVPPAGDGPGGEGKDKGKGKGDGKGKANDDDDDEGGGAKGKGKKDDD